MPAGPTAPPPDIRRFLLEVVDSFEKLELVLQLAVASAGAPIADAALAGRLGASADLAADALRDLVADGVVAGSRAQGWILDETSSWAPAAHALERLHAQDRTAVVNLMMTTSLDRLRGTTARAFADAFILRRKKEEPDG